MRNSETVDSIVALVDVELEGATHQLDRMCGPPDQACRDFRAEDVARTSRFQSSIR
jgi:hypothetical protein